MPDGLPPRAINKRASGSMIERIVATRKDKASASVPALTNLWEWRLRPCDHPLQSQSKLRGCIKDTAAAVRTNSAVKGLKGLYDLKQQGKRSSSFLC